MQRPDNDDDCDTGLMVMLDANCINARQSDAAINQLEQWCDEERVEIIMCETSHRESYADGSAQRFRKATQYPYSSTHVDTDEERRQLTLIEKAIFPEGAKTPNQKNDVDVVFNALKYCGFLLRATERHAASLAGFSVLPTSWRPTASES